MVVLKVPAKGRPLRIGESGTAQVGDPVYVVGNPQGLEGAFSEGIVSGVRQFGQDKLLQITAPISPGSSGGPVLNAWGEVIGVAVATFAGGQNLNFAIPSDYLKPLLHVGSAPVPLASLAANRKRPPFSGAIGESVQSAVTASAFLWDRTIEETSVLGDFTLSVKNNLREPIRDVYLLAIFFDAKNQPFDISFVRGGSAVTSTGSCATVQRRR